MAQLRDIKNRIDSVKKTRKMTQAMKMVAAAKFKRASDRTAQSKGYIEELRLMLAAIGQQMETEVQSRFLEKNDSKKEVVLVVSGDRGLCGGFNANILKFADNYLKHKDKGEIELVLVGTKAAQYYKNKQWTILSTFEGVLNNSSVELVHELLDPLLERYKQGEIGRVQLLYNAFISAVANEQVNVSLLPVCLDNMEESSCKEDYYLEPSADAVVDMVLSEYLILVVFRGLLESYASEQGSRMSAMDSATTNAGEMVDALMLVYNRQRQAQITTELAEIVAGAEALAG